MSDGRIRGNVDTSVLGWVDKLAFAVFGALVLGLGAWNLHTAHQNAIQIAEVRVEVSGLKNNREIRYIKEQLNELEQTVEKLNDSVNRRHQ